MLRVEYEGPEGNLNTVHWFVGQDPGREGPWLPRPSLLHAEAPLLKKAGLFL
jgi:hypothetical protein